MRERAALAGDLGCVSDWGGAGSAEDPEYRPFPDVERRNAWQERVELPLMVAALGLPAAGRVLEVGCGRGVALPVLARLLRPRRLVGVDADRSLLELARKRCGVPAGVVEVRRADVRALPYPDASFDLVVDFGTCYHVARRHQALREIARVLADGGLFAYETRLSQVLSHPLRSLGRGLPWPAAPELAPRRNAGLWALRERRARSR